MHPGILGYIDNIDKGREFVVIPECCTD